MVMRNGITSASVLHYCIYQSMLTAGIHCWPFSHALMVALFVTTIASVFYILLHRPQRSYSCDPLLASSHVLMVACYVTASPSMLHRCISQSKLAAVIHCWPFCRG